MKQLKKIMVIFVVATTVFCVGCSEDASSKASTDTTSKTSTETSTDTKADGAAEGEKKAVEAGDTIEADSFSVVAPKGWQEAQMQAMEGAISIAKGNDKSITIAMMEAPAELANLSVEDYKKTIEANFEVQKDLGLTLNKAEVQTKPYGDIVYIEMSTKITQELIDASMESGLLTQEALDAVGGVEAYIKNMSLEQICAYLIKDGKILMVSAQVLNAENADSIRDEANFVIDNLALK